MEELRSREERPSLLEPDEPEEPIWRREGDSIEGASDRGLEMTGERSVAPLERELDPVEPVSEARLRIPRESVVGVIEGLEDGVSDGSGGVKIGNILSRTRSNRSDPRVSEGWARRVSTGSALRVSTGSGLSKTLSRIEREVSGVSFGRERTTGLRVPLSGNSRSAESRSTSRPLRKTSENTLALSSRGVTPRGFSSRGVAAREVVLRAVSSRGVAVRDVAERGVASTTRGEEPSTRSRKPRIASSPRERTVPALDPPLRTRAVRGFRSRSSEEAPSTNRAVATVACTDEGSNLRYPARVTTPERKSLRLQTFQPPR
jgi:hypothetical protein